MKLVYWSVSLSSRRGRDGVKELKVGFVVLAQYKFHFIREHENLVQDTSKNVSNFIGKYPVLPKTLC